MSEQVLDDADIDTLLQKVGGEAVPQRMWSHVWSRPASSAAWRKARCTDRSVIGD